MGKNGYVISIKSPLSLKVLWYGNIDGSYWDDLEGPPPVLGLQLSICVEEWGRIAGVKRVWSLRHTHTDLAIVHNHRIQRDRQLLVGDGSPNGVELKSHDHTTVVYKLTCSAINQNPLSSLMHSKVSPRMGLKGLEPALCWVSAYEDTAKAATLTIRS